MLKKQFNKNIIYCITCWVLFTFFILVLVFLQKPSRSFPVAIQYHLNNIDQQRQNSSFESILYEGKFHIIGNFIYSNKNNQQLVYLSGDGLYHKSTACPHFAKHSKLFIYYAALPLFPQLQPCDCSSEDNR